MNSFIQVLFMSCIFFDASCHCSHIELCDFKIKFELQALKFYIFAFKIFSTVVIYFKSFTLVFLKNL